MTKYNLNEIRVEDEFNRFVNFKFCILPNDKFKQFIQDQLDIQIRHCVIALDEVFAIRFVSTEEFIYLDEASINVDENGVDFIFDYKGKEYHTEVITHDKLFN